MSSHSSETVQKESGLRAFVEQAAASSALRVEESFGEGFVRLLVSEAERRQAAHDIRSIEDALIELLRNARDAHAHKIFVSTSRTGDVRTLVVIDDGDGLPESMRSKIFEARVTSKLNSMIMDKWGVHGRGMALFSIDQVAKQAEVITTAPGKGSSLKCCFDLAQVRERKDQSTWPKLLEIIQENDREDESEDVFSAQSQSEMLSARLSGPHNAIRVCCEFALRSVSALEVYIGSPAEIVATMRRRVSLSKSQEELLFIDDLSELPLCERCAAAADATELMKVAEGLGLEISERTAHRILSSEIKALQHVLLQLYPKSQKTRVLGRQKKIDLARDSRGLKLSEQDKNNFIRAVEKNFAYLAERYFIDLNAPTKLKVGPDKLTITLSFELDD